MGCGPARLRMSRLTFALVIREGVDPLRPLIYLWEVELANGGIYRYVGKASKGDRRPGRHYARKCERYFKGLPYKSQAAPLYREPHWQLADAWLDGRSITLTLLCNVAKEDIDDAEAKFQAHYGLPRRTPNGRRRPTPHLKNTP